MEAAAHPPARMADSLRRVSGDRSGIRATCPLGHQRHQRRTARLAFHTNQPARKEAGPAAWRIIDIQLPDRDQAVTPETFGFKPVTFERNR